MPDLPRVWVPSPEIHLPPEILQAAGGDPLTASILLRRGLDNPDAIRGFLDPDQYTPASPYELPGMDRAVNRILRAVRDREMILIWGDFDADGQTSTTILYQTLQAIGGQALYHIPLRETEGHGMKPDFLAPYLSAGIQLIVTCDTGISESAAVALAVQSGADVIVTDHHELPERLPENAVAVIDPRMLAEGHPLGSLPGCGVAWELSCALLKQYGNPIAPDSLLDLAALGIVADLAELRGDTRYLLQRGLVELRQNRRPGLAQLLTLLELNPETIQEEEIAFYLAPRLNALGRLADASLAVDFFTTHDLARAAYLAQELDGLNTRRKLLTDQVTQAALAQINQHPDGLERSILIVDHPDWPSGVLGIVASQLVGRYGKPAIVFQSQPGGLARGSARSVAGIHITEAIASQRDLLTGFGGHPMAAGLSLPTDRLPEFRQRMHFTVAAQSAHLSPETRLVIDAVLPLNQLSLETAERLNRLSPFGPGNPAPVLLAPTVQVISNTVIGKYKEHLRLQIQDEKDAGLDAIWWQAAGQSVPEGWVQLAYSLRVNTFRGNRQLQLEWMDSQPVGDAGHPAEIRRSPNEHTFCAQRCSGAEVQIIDARRLTDEAIVSAQLFRGERQTLLFAEAEWHAKWQGRDRTELESAATLVMGTFPPGGEELTQITRQVKPDRVVLIGRDPGLETVDSFLRRLMGILKFHTHQEEKPFSLAKLGAAMASRECSVQLGLQYLSDQGELRLKPAEPGMIRFEWAQLRPSIHVRAAATRLERNLAETAAFRRHLLTLPVEDWRSDWFH